MRHRVWNPASIALALVTLGPASFAQYNERPSLAGSGLPDVDVSGRSIKNKRVRAVHTDDPLPRGGTANLIRKDPYLAYQLGRNLNFREFRTRDGVFSDVSPLAGPMPDGTTAKITANNQTSCLGCHNLPNGNPGGGANFHKDSGVGRNSPHYYGAGVVEMLALQVRADMLSQLDTNDDGWVNVSEANAGGSSITVSTTPGHRVDYGAPELTNGSPTLNNIFKVFYVDSNGQVVPGATSIDGTTTFGYNFEMIVWGAGQGPGRAALNPTNRAFLWDPFNAHSGLESHDPTTNTDLDGDGLSDAKSLSGAQQFPVSHRAPDAGLNLDPLGFSRDDPDGDGTLTEISEGDLDLAEWFMLNAPRPAFRSTEQQYSVGLELLDSMQCTSCHVPDWSILPADETFDGDRRLFDLDVTWNSATARLEGELVPLYTRQGDQFVPDRGAFLARGVFTDLKHHDMGPGFAEKDFGGNVNTWWRTPPLWGVGTSFPWGHDGASLTLHDAIVRHTGEGQASRDAYLNAPQSDRRRLIRFLEQLALYDIESLPADIDGDGAISEPFVVAGMDTGIERFNAEWLFRVPVQIQGPFTNSDGVVIRSDAATNIPAAYAETLPLRKDSDDDGWPDVWDTAPLSPGFRDGVN